MTKMVIVGGGVGGLAAALFSARRGHDVVVVERDASPPEGDPEEDFACWARPGVPQARHSHNFLGLGCGILDREAPEVVDALIGRGGLRVEVAVAGYGAEADDPAFSLLCRRLVFEAVLRRAAEREPGVTMLAATAVDGLVTDGAAPVPICRGVRTSSGQVIDADLVIDAGGHRSAVPAWLDASGAARPTVQTQECGFHYQTRFYRLFAGADFPTVDIPIVAALDYATVMAFPGDNRTFSLTVAASIDDPMRRRLREPSRFERFLAAVPLTREWVEVGEPITEINLMAGIDNRWRRLTDAEGRPVAGGMVLVGDASLHTNPTFGRGMSLALAQAQHLADSVDRVHADPVGFVAAFEDWTAANLGIWYHSQVAADRAALARLAAGLRGEHLPPADDPISRFIAGMIALAPNDPVVGRALARIAHLLATPAALLADGAVVGRVRKYLDDHPVIDPPVDGPTRAEFEELVAG